MAIIENQNPYNDYEFMKEYDAIRYYEENRLKKEFEILIQIFQYSDNAIKNSEYIFSICFYRSSDKDKYIEISIEVETDKFKIGVFSNDEYIRKLITIPGSREVAKTLKEAYDILNYYIGEIHHLSTLRKIDVELPLIDGERYWEVARKSYYETLENISSGKVKEIYG